MKAVPLALSLVVSLMMLGANAAQIGQKSAAGSQKAASAPAAVLKDIAGAAKSLSPAATEGASASAVEGLQQSTISEEVMPLSADLNPDSTVSPDSVLSVRLTSERGIDPKNLQATINGAPVDPRDLTWRATEEGNDTDGWAMYKSSKPLPTGTVTLLVIAHDALGEEIQSDEEKFSVVAEQQESRASGAPELEEATDIEPLPKELATSDSVAYRLKPAEVYKEPTTVQLEVPGGNPDDYQIYYYSESGLHCGWFPAESVKGWMAPDSRKSVEEGGKAYVEAQINHSGVVQLGKASTGTALAAETDSAATADSSGGQVSMKNILDELLKTVQTAVDIVKAIQSVIPTQN